MRGARRASSASAEYRHATRRRMLPLSRRLIPLLLGQDLPWLRRLWLALRPKPGAQADARQWEADYRTGRWDHLGNRSEAAHHAIVAMYYAAHKGAGRVLDVGCGVGTTHDHIAAHGYARYLGIDLSETAIARAAPRAGARAAFRVADAARFETDERFDVIVLNEVLYFVDDRAGLVRRYRDLLAPGGVLVVSMVVSGVRSLAYWDVFDGQWELLDTTAVGNAEPVVWIVKALRPGA